MNKEQARRIQECKGPLRHAWFEIDADAKPLFGFYMWFKCERCGTIRMDTVDTHGNLGARSYRHPEGWKEVERESMNEMRLTVISYRPKNKRKRIA